MISENTFILPEGAGQITVRWGLLPPQSTIDPGAVDAIDEPSWLLDMDTFQQFSSDDRVLEVNAIVEQTRGYAERNYSIFRWAVTDKFLRRYEGEPWTLAAGVIHQRRNDLLFRHSRHPVSYPLACSRSR